MLGPPKLRSVDRPITLSLDDLVPADHFYRHLDAHLDLTFVRDHVKDRYAERGRPSIDPVVFFRLQLLMFFEGIRSERKLIETASLNLAHRWYLGYNLDEPLPDHSSLTRIRQRLGLEIFRDVFEHVVELCRDAGLIWGKELLVDATKVPGNASTESLVPRLAEVVDDHLVELFGRPEDKEERTAAPEPDETAPPLLHPPQSRTESEESTEREEQAQRWDLLEECRLNPDRPLSQGYERISHRKVSTTDPDATLMTLPDKRIVLGYQTHYMIDGGRARIIPGTRLRVSLTMPGDVMENQPFLDQFRRVCFRWKVSPARVIADTKYSTIENVRALDALRIKIYMPLRDWEHKTEYFGSSHFTYDAEHDLYRCPQGTELRPSRIEWKAEKTEYQADAATCNACPLKSQCTPSDRGRQLHRSFHAAAMERVKSYQETPAYQKAMRKRQVWIEPLFGEAKQWHGLDRFRLRGLQKVNMETLVVATGQNLKRYLAARGWGRRHGPAGSLSASLHPVASVSPLP